MSDLPSTEELQRLLDEAKPGNWQFHEDEDWEHVVEGYPPMRIGLLHEVAVEGETLFNHANAEVLVDYPGTLRLAAHSRDLAAEVIRLRQGINDLKKAHVDALNHPVGDGSLYFHSNAIFELSRILEGDQA